ncbi:hypothetical protein ACJJTC_003767 [Scirpophaga incertulas]
MDSVELLAREDEFKKLNKQLERKTESLIKEIEHAMQRQDIFSEFSHNLSLTPTHSSKKHSCKSPPLENQDLPQKRPVKLKRATATPQKDSPTSNSVQDEKITQNLNDSVNLRRNSCNCCIATRRDNKNDDLEFLHAFVSVSIQEKVLPLSFQKDAISIQSVCKFLSSKLKLLQEQIDTLQATLNKKASQCEAHLARHAELESERLGLLNRCNSLQAAAAHANAKSMAAERKLAEKDRLYKECRSECDRLSCDLKKARGEYAAVCSREAAQSDDFRDSTRALSASNQTTIGNLEARVKVVSAAIDKHAALVNNLRRQNAILRADRALQALEKEYSDFLNQDL